MSDAPETPDPPFRSVNLGRLNYLIGSIVNDDVALALLGSKPAAEDIPALAHMITRRLGEGVQLKAVRDSLTHLGDTTITQEVLVREAHRLAANIARLKQGRSVPPWCGQQRADEWVLVEIIDLRQRRNFKDELGFDVEFNILSGQTATLTAKRFWSYRLIHYIADKIGFDPRYKVELNILENPHELSGLKFYLIVRAAKSVNSIFLEKVRCPLNLKKENRALIRDRKRRGAQDPCPQKYKHPCWKCWLGFDRCRLAVHPRTFVKHFCETCKKEAWFDPLFLDVGHCAACMIKIRSERKR